jgi:hypothetical protein
MQAKDYNLVDVNNSIDEIMANKNVYLIRDFPLYKEKGSSINPLDDE